LATKINSKIKNTSFSQMRYKFFVNIDVKKFFVLGLFIYFAVGFNLVFAANGGEGSVDSLAAIEAEKVKAVDLGIADPGVLPTNPLYFLKEWRRNIKLFFTFNPISRVELEFLYANEKAAEAQKVGEKFSEKEAIAKAAENYIKSQERLKTKLMSLQETSSNPNVDRLLGKLAEQSVKHAKIFEELSQKFEGEQSVKKAMEKTIETVAEAIKKDEPVKFAAKIEKILMEEKGDEFKHFRSLEVIDKIYNKAPEEAKISLERLREDFSNRFNEDLKNVVQKIGEQNLKDALATLAGDESRRLVILEEIKAKANNRVAEAIGQANSLIEEAIKEKGDIAARAKEQITIAEAALNELRKRFESVGNNLPSAAKQLFENAEKNLKIAREAYEAGDYGESYGRARSAEVLARSAFRLFEEKAAPTSENLEEKLVSLEIKIKNYGEILESRHWTKDNQPKVYELLDNAKTHLNYAREEFSKKNFAGAVLHIGHVNGFLKDLLRIIEESSKLSADVISDKEEEISPLNSQCEIVKNKAAELEKMFLSGAIGVEDYEKNFAPYKEILTKCANYQSPAAPTPVKSMPAKPVPVEALPTKPPSLLKPTPTEVPQRFPEQNFCIELYDPVCGVDGKTYSNDCYANRAGVKIQYRGKCQTVEKPTTVACPFVREPSAEEVKKCSSLGGNYQKNFDERNCIINYSCVSPVSAPSTIDYVTAPLPAKTDGTDGTNTTAAGIREFKLEADDFGFYPNSVISVPRNSKIRLTFAVRTSNVYYGGLDFRSSKFKTEAVKPGGSVTVEFAADESFEFQSYWPLSGVLKARGKVIVE